jgi:hypothetical protein
VIDVTDPANPTKVGFLDSSILQGTAGRVALTSNHAYVTVQEGGLQVLDTADPSHPRIIGSYVPSGSVQAVAVPDDGNHHVYIISREELKGILHVIDIADSTHPEEIGSVELSKHSLSNVMILGNYAYVALTDCYYFTCQGGLHAVDISDPAQPRMMSSLDIPGGAFSVAMVDGGDNSSHQAYLAAGEVGVWVVNVSDPAHPHLAGLANTPGRAQSITVVGDLVYVADDNGGFLSLRVRGSQ